MKKLAILIISLYQIFLSPLFKQIIGVRNTCRFSPSCSEYTKISIGKYGLIKGIQMGINRLLHCHPFNNNDQGLDIWMICKARARSATSRTNDVRGGAPQNATQQIAKCVSPDYANI